MAYANAVRFNTTVSAADSRLAGMQYAQKVAQTRLERSAQRDEEARVGLGRIVALYNRSSTSYQIH